MFTQFVGLLQTQASRDIAVQGIMGRGLISDHIRNHPAPHQFGIDLGSIPNQSNRKWLTRIASLSHLRERLVQRTRHLITIARLQASFNMLWINLDGKANTLIHSNGQWLRSSRQMPFNESGRYPP